MTVHLGMDINELAKLMGHASTSTLRNALAGTGGLDIERLHILSNIQSKSGELPNLDWLLTGRGTALIPHQPPNNNDWQEWLSSERKQALKLLASSPLPQ
jgi:hypothetical protein